MNLSLLFLPALSVILAVVAQSAPARAVCLTECGSSCSEYGPGGCIRSVPLCPPTCRNSAPAHSYGAIAYGSKSGAWGSSYHWDSEAKAESSAMQSCAKHGDDCEVMVWFDRKCGAVAAADDAVAFWGLGDSENQARADAQNKCVNGGGKNCEVQASECSK